MAMTSILVLVLKVLMILVFAGWVCIWLLKPTERWTKSWHTAEESVRTTFIGYNGLNFLVYSFPLIVVAIIGFVRIHLKDKEPRSSGKWMRFSFINLSNPVIARSPLGTLSGNELLVGALFFLFLAWTFYAHISSDFNKMEPVKSLKLNIWQYKVWKIGVRFGLLAEACLALLLLPILRGMALFRLLNIQFEASVRYHVWLGTAMILFATLHGSSIFFVWGVKNTIQDKAGLWQKTGRIYLAGEIALATVLVIWITSLPLVRRRQFELFYYTHHLYVIFFVFFMFHVGDRHFYMVFGGILLFALDKLLRIIQSRTETCILSARIFPCKVLELTLQKPLGLKYTPTSTIFIKIPSISKFQWHPFSVTSNSNIDKDTISVMIRCDGEWTSLLFNMITGGANHMKCIPVAVEGPYGPDSINFLRYDSLILVAGGIGITPIISILQEIICIHGSNKNNTPSNVQLISVVKKSQDISLLNPIWPILLNQNHEQVTDIKIKVYVTREEKSSKTIGELVNELSHVETVSFDTKSSSYAMSGPVNLLWMAATAGFSSIVFLIMLGCFNHTVLHTEDKAFEKKHSTWVTDLFLLCSFVISITCATLATVIARWRKTENEIPENPTKQVEEVEHSWLEARGDDLERYQIHYGQRPNLQDLLSKLPIQSGGSDVGVIVCGPESMKESVASLCQQNLHCLKTGDRKTKPNFIFHPLNFAL